MSDAIDWDAIAPRYHDHVLSPFAPEMAGRNPLLDDLLAMPLEGLDIADFGCGPGNLIPHLAGRGARLVGVDSSAAAIALATEVAERHAVAFEGVCGDFRTVDLADQFDVIVAVNSVLPPVRNDVVPVLSAMGQALKPEGQLLAILPSYDTTVYLRQLLGEDWAHRHKSDDVQLLFADDGATQQAYHSPDSMAEELPRAGLRLVRDPRKVRYPWSLTRRFDYGDVPAAPEEVWDWYVVAQSAE